MVRTMRLAAPMTGRNRASVEGWTVDRQGDLGRVVQFSGGKWTETGSGNAVEMVGSSKDKEE